MDKIYDYIVIGSGFGGSVSAMRLAEKGYDVLILEKGREYKTKDFPKTNWEFRKYFWAPALRWFGIQKLTFFKEVFIISGVGVGGGSLVYANSHMFPSDEFFNNPVWANLTPEKTAGGSPDSQDWKSVLAPFYEKARFMLGTIKNHIFNREDELLKEVAQDMGCGASYEGVSVGVYFGDTEKEVDPYFKGLGPMRKGCTECAGCMVGCRENAKNTLDKNYLYFAKKFGAELESERKVEVIEQEDGCYRVHTYSSTSWFKGRKRVYLSKNIVISGGVLGTMDMLLKQKYKYKTLPGLSDTLGDNLRTNSESLCAVTSPDKKLNHGIAITSVFNPDKNTHIEVVKYPDKSNAMRAFATLATGPGAPIVRIVKLLYQAVRHPLRFFKHLFNRDWARNSVIFLVMQNLDNAMKMKYKRFPFGRISIWNKRGNRVPSYIDIGQEVMHRYAKKINGVAQNAVTEVLFNMSSTAHILGGCPMGETEENGVVNNKFEVFNYPGMYILDGSIMPCNLGVNPSLTITALSEYAMAYIQSKKGNTNVPLDEQLSELGSC